MKNKLPKITAPILIMHGEKKFLWNLPLTETRDFVFAQVLKFLREK